VFVPYEDSNHREASGSRKISQTNQELELKDDAARMLVTNE